MSERDPFAPVGGYGQAGKPAPQRATPSRYSAMAAYGDYARPQAQMMRPTQAALSAYGAPRQRPMGYGYGMPRRAYRDPGSPSDPFSNGGGY